MMRPNTKQTRPLVFSGRRAPRGDEIGLIRSLKLYKRGCSGGICFLCKLWKSQGLHFYPDLLGTLFISFADVL